MKNKFANTRAFTIVELLVVLTIIGVLSLLVIGSLNTDPNDPNAYILNPEQDAARNSRRIVNEMERQNDLKEQEIEILKQRLLKAEQE